MLVASPERPDHKKKKKRWRAVNRIASRSVKTGDAASRKILVLLLLRTSQILFREVFEAAVILTQGGGDEGLRGSRQRDPKSLSNDMLGDMSRIDLTSVMWPYGYSWAPIASWLTSFWKVVAKTLACTRQSRKCRLNSSGFCQQLSSFFWG